ncbi:MAG: lysozyme inhibitor LprI family protein [Cellvibrionaceae bacterium]
MKKYFFLLLALPLSLFGEEKIDCETAYTTIEVNICIKQEADRAHSGLEKYLAKAKARFSSEADVVETLNKSQESWLAYREAHCNAVYEQWSGGTIRGAMFGSCLLRLTKLRTHVIWQDYLSYMDSTKPLLPEPKL